MSSPSHNNIDDQQHLSTQNTGEETPSSPISNHFSPTTLSYAMAIFVLGASAGMTMYTRRTGAMLSRIHQYEVAQKLRNPPKYGPPTKAEYEKMKVRW
jgi:hypothetical protein